MVKDMMETRRIGEESLMTGFRTGFLAINILNSLTSEGLQADISPVRPPIFSSFHLLSLVLRPLAPASSSGFEWS